MSSGMELNIDSTDLKRFEKTCERMGGLPQKAAQRAASKGMTVVRKQVKRLIPVGKTGNLKKGLYRKGEKHRRPGKFVYQLKYDPKMNAVFQKPIKRPGLYGGKHYSHGYYPNSVEYGFLTRAKGGGLEYRTFSRLTQEWEKRGGRWKRKRVDETVAGYQSRQVEGQHVMQRGAEAAAAEATRKIADTLVQEAEKVWTKD